MVQHLVDLCRAHICSRRRPRGNVPCARHIHVYVINAYHTGVKYRETYDVTAQSKTRIHTYVPHATFIYIFRMDSDENGEECQQEILISIATALMLSYAAIRRRRIALEQARLKSSTKIGRGAPGRPRRSRPRQNREGGCFARVIFAPDVELPDSLAGEDFRETFRVRIYYSPL